MSQNLRLSKLFNNIKCLIFFITAFLSLNFWVNGLTTDSNNIYQIETREDLFEFAKVVNGTHETIKQDEGANATLINDINIIESDDEIEILLDLIENEGSNVDKLKNLEWTPIGNNIKNSYTGTFDGQDKNIKNIYCDISSKNRNAAGLFGFLGPEGKIKNINVNNVYIKTREGKEANYAGGICGYNDAGNIIECLCEKARICSINGHYGNYSGGICGYNIGMGRISMCTSKDVNIVSTDGNGNNFSGGICGYNAGSIIQCFSGIRKLLSKDGQYYNDIGCICGKNINSIIECYYSKDFQEDSNDVIEEKKDIDSQIEPCAESKYKYILIKTVDDID
ncbi:MAG: hypothetical protein J6C55_00395 [Oscillospiraceae bacterium]|nr:hypothetical protein [Oscillospiraceae bacterium]